MGGTGWDGRGADLVGVVQIQDPAAALVDLLVRLADAAHDQRGVHVHVVAGEVEGDEALEDDGPAREGGGEEDEQARRRAAVGHHVEHGAEARRLAEVARGVAVESVEEARDAVEQRAGARVEGHVVEGAEGEDDAYIAFDHSRISVLSYTREREEGGRGYTDYVRPEEKNVLVDQLVLGDGVRGAAVQQAFLRGGLAGWRGRGHLAGCGRLLARLGAGHGGRDGVDVERWFSRDGSLVSSQPWARIGAEALCKGRKERREEADVCMITVEEARRLYVIVLKWLVLDAAQGEKRERENKRMRVSSSE